MLKIVNQTIVFLIELIMFGSFACFGFQKGNGLVLKYGFAILLTLLAILLWAYWAAPKSENRLKMPYLAIFRLFLFFLASFFLYRLGFTKFALILAFISTVTQIASVFLEGNE
nr:YrdB family protein [uncultured Pedobacter sp.]